MIDLRPTKDLGDFFKVFVPTISFPLIGLITPYKKKIRLHAITS